MNDIDDHLAYLRYERGKAAQTLATYRRLLYQFAEAHRDRDLHALEPRDLQNYLTKTLGGGKYSPATLNQHRAALRSYYRWLHRLRGLPTDPAAALKLPRQARQPPSAPRLLAGGARQLPLLPHHHRAALHLHGGPLHYAKRYRPRRWSQ